jgi:hypothetical protein
LSVQNTGSGKNTGAAASSHFEIQPLAELDIGADTARNGPDVGVPVASSAADRFCDEHIDDRRLKFARDVGLGALPLMAPLRRHPLPAGRASQRPVFNPEKLKSRLLDPTIGRGSLIAFGRPCDARPASAGPPG